MSGRARDIPDLDAPDRAEGPTALAGAGKVVPARIGGRPVSVVTDYATALALMDTERFPPTPLNGARPLHCPVAGVLRPAGDTIFGQSYREFMANTDSEGIRSRAIESADRLTGRFVERGRADLLTDYAQPLAREVFAGLLGLSESVEPLVVEAATALRAAADLDAAAHRLLTVVAEAIATGQASPSTGFARAPHSSPEHSARCVAALYAAGLEPTWNLIANTLLRLMIDPDLDPIRHGGGVSVEAAVELTVLRDPPIPYAVVAYPHTPVEFEHGWLSHEVPVIVSILDCHRDLDRAELPGGQDAHLGFGARDRQCPAARMARTVAVSAVEMLLDWVPDIAWGSPNPPRYLPGAARRGLTALPVVFAPTHLMNPLHETATFSEAERRRIEQRDSDFERPRSGRHRRSR
ncbi:hypothetical protein ACWEKT_20315 [Nocardia takedensis]|uniref:hypothetical protein n=1 Tax=Nocardia takedensis TaxID=259390 RepID=UPI0002E37E55|nr:hypothetical protein [Nocardia takedensis]